MTKTSGDDSGRFDVMFSNPGAIAQSCARCGRAFGCGRDLPSCWCSELPQLPADRIDPDIDCLCPVCLDAITKHSPAAGDT